MKRVLKWTGIFLAVVIVVVVSLPFLINVDQFRPTLQSELSRALGREVTLGNLQLKILSGGVVADDLSVAEDPAFGKPAFLRAQSLHVGVKIWPFLLSRNLVVTDLTIDRPEIALVQAPSGGWNFSSLGGNRSSAAPSRVPSSAQVPLNLLVQQVDITNGHVSLRRTVGHWKPLVLEQVEIHLSNFSAAGSFPYSLSAQVHGGGSLNLNGTAGPLNPSDSSMTPVRANLSASQLDLAGSGLNDFAPDVEGLISLTAAGDSDGLNLHLNGKLNAAKLKLRKTGTPAARPVQLDFALQHNLRKHSGVLQKGDIHIGGASAHLTGNYAEQGESVILNMKLSGPNMPIQELEAMLPPLGIVLPAGTSLQGGTASASLSSEGPADRLVTVGSLSLNNTRLAGFDLPKKMASIERLAGIQAAPDTNIQTVSANVRVAPEGISADDMKLVIPAMGDLSGAGTISASNALDFKMSAQVHTSGILGAISDRPIPFLVGGTCSDPVFRPDVKAIVKDEINGLGNDVGKTASGILKGLLGGGKKKN